MSNQILLDALENERRYTAKEMHDGVAQTTLQLGLQAGICRKLLERNNLEMLALELAQLEEQVQKASGQVRDLIQDLRPPTIEAKGDLDEYVRYVIDVHLERAVCRLIINLPTHLSRPCICLNHEFWGWPELFRRRC